MDVIGSACRYIAPLLWLLGLCPAVGAAMEIQGLELDVGYQVRGFPEDGLRQDAGVQQSVELHIQGYWPLDDAEEWALTLSGVARADNSDHRRTGVDLTEAYVSRVNDGIEWHVGNRRVFWGVLEFVHLIDVINSVDLAADIDEETRLGQLMIQNVWLNPLGIDDALEFYLLPGHRDKRFPSRRGRLGGDLDLIHDSDHDSADGQRHLDVALRYQFHLGAIDVALMHFAGTTREPLLRVTEDGRFQAFYDVIDQSSMELQWGVADWAFKLEALSRAGAEDRYTALGGGFERTFVGLFGGADLGVVAELYWDDRDGAAPPGHFEHDLALGLRFSPNDAADSQVLLGLINDLHGDESVFSLEASTRLAEQWRVSAEGRAFGGSRQQSLVARLLDKKNKTALLSDEDYLQLELRYFLR